MSEREDDFGRSHEHKNELTEEEIDRDFESMMNSMSEPADLPDAAPVPINQSLRLPDLPDPNDETFSLLVCQLCYKKMQIIISFTAFDDFGTCTDNFCKDCVLKLQQQPGPLRCPACYREVKAWGENKAAMILAKQVEINKKSDNLERQNEMLVAELHQLQQLLSDLQIERQRETDSLQHLLAQERTQQESLSQRLQTLNETHQRDKQKSEDLIRAMQKQIQDIQNSSHTQILELDRYRAQLGNMQQNKELHQMAMVDLEKKIKLMENQLKSSMRVQADLEYMRSMAIHQLQQREEEVKTIRVQMKRQVNSSAIQLPSGSQEGLLNSVGKLVGTFFWGSTASGTGIVRPVSDYRIAETRGNRKDGRVKKASFLPEHQIVALKRVVFQSPSAETSMLSSFVSSWWSTPEPVVDPNKAKAQASLSFREAMLLSKLQHEHLISVEKLVEVTKGEFYMQMPFMEYDLDYLLETQKELFTPNVLKQIMFQILSAVLFLHSGNIVHRHLSTQAVLLNDTSHVRLGGFSFAISLSSEVLDVSLPRQNLVFSAPELLYKAPELQPTGDWKHIDMWAVGCIFARLLGNSYLFSGTTTKGMIESILSVTECRPDPQFKFNNNIPMLTQCLQSNPNPRPLAEKLLSAGPDALDLLKRIFKFEPASRITAEEALQHPYFKDIYKVSPMCAVGHECTDEELLEFIDTYCPTLL